MLRPCRVYQDADVNVTLNFISEEPLRLPPIRSLPGTTSSLLRLDPDSLVFYVGGYPENFTVTNYENFLFSLSVTDLLKVLLQNQIFHAMKTNKEDIKYKAEINNCTHPFFLFPSLQRSCATPATVEP